MRGVQSDAPDGDKDPNGDVLTKSSGAWREMFEGTPI